MLPIHWDEEEWFEPVAEILDDIACGRVRHLATRRADRRSIRPATGRR